MGQPESLTILKTINSAYRRTYPTRNDQELFALQTFGTTNCIANSGKSRWWYVRRQAEALQFEKVRSILWTTVPLVRMVDYKNRMQCWPSSINTLGVKLRKADHQLRELHLSTLDSSPTGSAFSTNSTKHQGFNRLNIMHLFRVICLRAGRTKPNASARAPKREVLAAWKRFERATEQAIGLIRSEAIL